MNDGRGWKLDDDDVVEVAGAEEEEDEEAVESSFSRKIASPDCTGGEGRGARRGTPLHRDLAQLESWQEENDFGCDGDNDALSKWTTPAALVSAASVTWSRLSTSLPERLELAVDARESDTDGRGSSTRCTLR